MTRRRKPLCVMCGDNYSAKRANAGYNVCMPCGEDVARAYNRARTVVPMHKSNYMLITDLTDLTGINNKGGLVK